MMIAKRRAQSAWRTKLPKAGRCYEFGCSSARFTLCTMLYALCFFTSCQGSKPHGVLMAGDTASHFAVPVHTIAVLPVQNATGRNLVLYTGRGSIVDRVAGDLLEGKNKAVQKPGPVANPLHVQDSIEKGIFLALNKKGYDLASPSTVKREYFRISNENRGVTPFELSLSIPADAFLMVTVTKWDADDYLTYGRVRAAFDMRLIRSNNGQELWKKEIPFVRYELRDATTHMISIYKRQDELLEDVSLRIIKDFPNMAVMNAPLQQINSNFSKNGGK